MSSGQGLVIVCSNIYIYLYNYYLSPVVRVLIQLMARCAQCNLIEYVRVIGGFLWVLSTNTTDCL